MGSLEVMNQSKSPSQINPLAVLIFSLAALFYLYEYTLQVAPSVMANSIMRDFHIGAMGLSTISAFYFYAYAPMQLPAGLLFDRYGPRRLITLAIFICVLGTIFFSLTQSVIMAGVGRFLIGTGSAFSFIGVLVLISRWFPPQYFALFAGIAQLMSSVGAIFGQYPLAKLSHVIGWRHSLLVLAAIGILLAGLVWHVVRDDPNGKPVAKKNVRLLHELQKLKVIWKKTQTWTIASYAFFIWTPIAVFGALWAVPYLQQRYHISDISAAMASSMIWLGIGIGSPLLGWASDKIKRRLMPMQLCAIVGLIASVFILYDYNLTFNSMCIILLLMGFSASGQTISFALVKENNKPSYVGTASGFNNLSVLLGGAIFQPVVGYLLNSHWHGTMLNHKPIYSLTAYTHALIILPICYIAALTFSLFFIKDTFGRPQPS